MRKLYILTFIFALGNTMLHAEESPLTVSIPAADYETGKTYEAGSSLTIYPTVDGGVAPYEYVWTNRMGETVGTDEALSVVLEQPEVYTVTVKSADGQDASTETIITVYGSDGNAAMEDNYLEPESSWVGYLAREYAEYPWFSGAFAFPNSYWAVYNFWSSFAYSNSTSNAFASLDDQFNTVSGGAYEGKGYGVSYLWSTAYIDVLKNAEGAELDHIYVNNTAYTASSIKNGDGFSQPFATGDYLKVTFSGDDEAGTPVEVYLADYRSEDASEHALMSDWTRVDLSPLGKVKKLGVTISSSSETVPTYFAFDDLAYKAADGIGDAVADMSAEPVSVRYISADGRVAAVCAASDASAAVSALPSGIYIVETTHADGSVKVKKAII